jgi:magnesium-transporting ATPase (P-type)
VIPADLRLLAVAGLDCDESVLTGESLPAEKSAGPVAAGTPLAELSCCALMGTVVQAGSGTGVVVATGGDAEFGRIAVGLGQRQLETEFQVGLRKFSMLLVQVAGVLTGAIFVINVALQRNTVSGQPPAPRPCRSQTVNHRAKPRHRTAARPRRRPPDRDFHTSATSPQGHQDLHAMVE